MNRREVGALIRTTGAARWYGNGHWQHPWYVRDALCEDGRRRTVRLNGEADTYFSWPGRTTIGGKSVVGFVTTKEHDDGTADTLFIANKFGGES